MHRQPDQNDKKVLQTLKEIISDLDKEDKQLTLDDLTMIHNKILSIPDLSEICVASKNQEKYLSAYMLEL